jgi:hypothetical protein
MSRTALALGSVLALALAIVAIVLLATRKPEPAPAAPGLRASAAISSTNVQFGDLLEARVEVVLRDPDAPADRVRIVPELAPFEVEDVVRTVQRTLVATRVVAAYTLSCLTQACLPPEQGGAAGPRTFDPGVVRVTAPGESGEHSVSIALPPVRVASRLTPADFEERRPSWRSGDASLPLPAFTVSPRGLSAGLLGGAGALVLAAIGLLAWQLRIGTLRLPQLRRQEPPLDRALRRVRRAMQNGDDAESRRALGLLGRELRDVGFAELATEAEHVAWSAPAPTSAAVELLTTEVAQTARRRRR